MCCCQLRRYLITVTVACFLVSLASSVPRDKYNMWEKQKGMIFFSILNYWFTCRSSVGSPLFAKIFTLGNIILGISLNVQGFQTRSNCFEWKSLIKHGHSTKSNNFWSQSNFQFSYGSKWNSHKENYYRTKPNFLIPNSWWQVCGFNSRFFYYCHIWSQF